MDSIPHFDEVINVRSSTQLYIRLSNYLRTESLRQPLRDRGRILETLIGSHNSSISQYTHIICQVIGLSILIGERLIIPGNDIILLELISTLMSGSELNGQIETTIRVLSHFILQRDEATSTIRIFDDHVIIRNNFFHSTIHLSSDDVVLRAHIGHSLISTIGNQKRHRLISGHRVLRSLDIGHGSSKRIVPGTTKGRYRLSDREPFRNRLDIRIGILDIATLTSNVHINGSLSIDTHVGREAGRQCQLTHHGGIIGTLVQRVCSISIQTRQTFEGSRVSCLLLQQRRHRGQIGHNRVRKDSIDNSRSLNRKSNFLSTILITSSIVLILLSKHLVEMSCYNLTGSISIRRQISMLDILIVW